MSQEIAYAASGYQFNADRLSKILAAVPPDRWLDKPGDKSNCLSWIAGHAIWARAQVLNMLGQTWTRPWLATFASGAPAGDAHQYPSPQDITAAWNDVAPALAAAIAKASPEQLAKPAPTGAPSFGGTLGGTVAFFSIHEAYHLGQLGYVRKWLGYGQSLG